MPTDRPCRRRDAGVTLVEVLVVLALLGVMAGAVALGLGPATRGAGAAAEAELLAARMRRASEEAVLTGAPVALAWDDGAYRFEALVDGAWAPHPLPLLAEARRPGGLEGAGRFVVTGAALPASGAALALRLDEAAVVWDGATARVAEAGP